MTTSVVYLTHDEVNAPLARRIAHHLGLDLIVLTVKEPEHVIAADQLVLDLDHLPPEWKSKLFHRVGNGELRSGLAVHSYHLTHAETRALRSAGVRVTRRLTAGTLVSRVSADSTA